TIPSVRLRPMCTPSTSSRSWTRSPVPRARTCSSARKTCRCCTASTPWPTPRRTCPVNCSPRTSSAASHPCCRRTPRSVSTKPPDVLKRATTWHRSMRRRHDTALLHSTEQPGSPNLAALCCADPSPGATKERDAYATDDGEGPLPSCCGYVRGRVGCEHVHPPAHGVCPHPQRHRAVDCFRDVLAGPVPLTAVRSSTLRPVGEAPPHADRAGGGHDRLRSPAAGR